MTLPITLTTAAAAALLSIWLAMRVGRVRMANKISIGHGGVQALERRMRAQANFVEYTPFFLILMALIELSRGSATWLWLVSIAYILARIAHAFGMDREDGRNPLRGGGILVTFVALIGLASYALAIPYLAKAAPQPTMITG